jgi:hypothetical protein
MVKIVLVARDELADLIVCEMFNSRITRSPPRHQLE